MCSIGSTRSHRSQVVDPVLLDRPEREEPVGPARHRRDQHVRGRPAVGRGEERRVHRAEVVPDDADAGRIDRRPARHDVEAAPKPVHLGRHALAIRGRAARIALPRERQLGQDGRRVVAPCPVDGLVDELRSDCRSVPRCRTSGRRAGPAARLGRPRWTARRGTPRSAHPRHQAPPGCPERERRRDPRRRRSRTRTVRDRRRLRWAFGRSRAESSGTGWSGPPASPGAGTTRRRTAGTTGGPRTAPARAGTSGATAPAPDRPTASRRPRSRARS